MLQTAADLLTEYPEAMAALVVLLRVGMWYQSELSWYEYRTVHGLKRLVFPVLDRRFAFVSFVNGKGGRDDPEFLTTVDTDIPDTVAQLREGGGTLHVISALKKRPAEHGDPLTRAHVVWSHADGKQTEAYCFHNTDGTTDLYVHVETGVTDPVGHLTDRQTDGDARGVVEKALQ